jgi:hypothetical protein
MAAPVHPYGDYGVALRTLRTSRNFLGYLLFSCVMLQIVGFLLMRFTTQPYGGGRPVLDQVDAAPAGVGDRQTHAAAAGVLPEARESRRNAGWNFRGAALENYGFHGRLAGTLQGRRLNLRRQWDLTYQLVVPVTQLLGLLAAAAQAIIIFVSLLVILVAQAPGVAHLTRSLIWAVILLFIVLPWQYVFAHFPVPGILYGWHELLHTLALTFLPPPGHGISFDRRVLIIIRYMAWPVFGLVLMLVTAERFRAGARLAIGHPLQSLMLGIPGGPAEASRPAGAATTVRPGVKI